MATVVKKTVSKNNSKTYASKDFDALRADLVTYARNYFSDQIKDFSEPSLGGMFVGLAAYVGDTLNYYLDHQFNELNPTTAIETRNIENHAKNAGVKAGGAASSIANVTFYIEVPAKADSVGNYGPDTSTFPIIKSDTELISHLCENLLAPLLCLNTNTIFSAFLSCIIITFSLPLTIK